MDSDSIDKKQIYVYFVKEHRHYFNKDNKKLKSDYVLNVNKIVKDKLGHDPIYSMNNIQAFLLNYEIKKIIDKAITVGSQKYDTIICVNSTMSVTGILNMMKFMDMTYANFEFAHMIIDAENEFDPILKHSKNVAVIKNPSV